MRLRGRRRGGGSGEVGRRESDGREVEGASKMRRLSDKDNNKE